MAKGNKYTCDVCGITYKYCERCAIVKPNYNAHRFCSHEHQDIFAILSKHGCDLATAEATLLALEPYNIDGIKFTEDIAAHIDRIKSEVIIKEEASPIEEEILPVDVADEE